MSDHVSDEQLEELAAGTLAADARAAAERHLSGCEACRAQAASLRTLLADLSALRGPILPARDLRPDIWRAIDQADAGPADSRGLEWPRRAEHTRFRSRGWLAAAAVLLVAVTSVLTWQVASRRGAPESVTLPLAAEYGAAAARYVAATTELEQFLDERRADLSQETVQILDESLRVIDRALAEAKEAIDADPGNTNLSRMLMATYEKKLGLLRSAAQGQAGI